MEDWTAAAADIAEGLAEAGFAATLTRTTTTDATPWNPGTTTVEEWAVTALDNGTKTRYGRDPQGSLIPRTVRVVLIAATGAVPQMGDTLTIGDDVLTLASVAPLQPGGQAILFEAEIAI